MNTALVVMGYATPEGRTKTRQRMTDFASRLSELSDVDVGIIPLPSYNHVAQRLHHREIDLAWLSPIPLISLTGNQRAIPLVSLLRDQLVHYRCALIVPSGGGITSLEQLRGKRGAWVDRLSAAGYVLPRIELASHGVNQADLRGEKFFGSHDAVVRAVASRRADFGATFARIARNGEVTGAWSRTPGLSRSIDVLHTFAEIPPDAIAARPDLDRTVREKLLEALFAMTQSPKDRALVGDALGADSFHPPEHTMYDAMRTTVFDAFKRGFLDTNVVQEEVIAADATLEHRPVDGSGAGGLVDAASTMPRLPSTPDNTQEAEIIEVMAAVKKI
jgi:phosphate/phosphite/phosphonate ABC transporter binding protein